MRLQEHLEATALRGVRALVSLRRPSAWANGRRLRRRHESLAALVVREVVPGDISALAALHVTTWNDTYAGLAKGPSVAIREQQWREAFDSRADWFAFVIARPEGELVAFAKGKRREAGEIRGEVNKIYVLRAYQRLGLGRRLLGLVARRFVEDGIDAMSAYVDPRNPSCGFFEALGGEWYREPDGSVNFSWYVWRDLPTWLRRCNRGEFAIGTSRSVDPTCRSQIVSGQP